MEQSDWRLTPHWTVGLAGQEYPSVTIDGHNSFDDRRFTVTISYDLTETGVKIMGISVLAPSHHLRTLYYSEAPDALSSNLLRNLPIDPIRALILESLNANPSLLTGTTILGKLIEDGHGTATDEERARFTAAQEAVEAAVAEATDLLRGARPSRGRGASNDDWWGNLATAYIDYHARFGKTCVRELAAELDVIPQTVSEWVRRARTLGWLSAAPAPGQAGGRPGNMLIDWLEKREERK